MEKLSYLATFVSLILGLGVANVLVQLSALIKKRRRADWYWIHALWTVFLLLALAGEWWVLLQWQRVPEIGFFTYLTLLLKPSLLFLASDLLFPEPGAGGVTSLKEHFFQIHRPFFLVLLAHALSDVMDTLLKGWAHFLSLGPFYPALMTGVVAMCLTGAATRREPVHAAIVLLSLLVYVLAILNALGSTAELGG